MKKISFVKALLIIITCHSFANCLYSGCSGDYCMETDGKIYNLKSLAEAQKICTNQNPESWLLEIYNEDVQTAVMNYINNYKSVFGQTSVLLGLKRQDNKYWTWIDGKTYEDTLMDTKYKIRIISNSIPFGTLRNLNLNILITPNSTSTTSRLNSYICSFKKDCLQDGSKYKKWIGNLCYVSYTDNNDMIWFDAQYKCVEKGGTLAVMPDSIPSNIEDHFRNITTSSTNYWIGLVKSYWVWMEKPDQLSNFTKWYSGFPVHNYLSQSPDTIGTYMEPYNGDDWMDGAVSNPRIIICMKDSSVATAFTTYSTTNASLAEIFVNIRPTHSNVGLGIGLGIGIPVCILVIVVAVIYARKNKFNKSNVQNAQTTKDKTIKDSRENNVTINAEEVFGNIYNNESTNI